MRRTWRMLPVMMFFIGLTLTVFQGVVVEDSTLEQVVKSISIEESTMIENDKSQGHNFGKGVILDSDSTKLELDDEIYKSGRWGNPLVVQKYKLVFFPIPKVACTEWKLLFRRILGLPEWDENVDLLYLHDPSYNGLAYLTNFTREEAQEMLTSDEWTRAVFVREPKERVLSAFMDKFVNKPFFAQKCCGSKHYGENMSERKYCRSKTNTMDFTYFLNRTLDCPNPHWTPQADAIDDKWWPYMTFVGYMDNVAPNAEKLLKSIRRKTKDGAIMTAWQEYGATGWGKDGTSPFMVRDTAHHATNAHDKLREVYTRCHEAFVEKHWSIEWKHPTYHFDKIRLFDDDDDEGSDLSECEIS